MEGINQSHSTNQMFFDKMFLKFTQYVKHNTPKGSDEIVVNRETFNIFLKNSLSSLVQFKQIEASG